MDICMSQDLRATALDLPVRFSSLAMPSLINHSAEWADGNTKRSTWFVFAVFPLNDQPSDPSDSCYGETSRTAWTMNAFAQPAQPLKQL